MSISDNIKSIEALGGMPLKTLESPYAGSRGKQYFGNASRQYVAANAKYATDYFNGQTQGVGDDFYTYYPCGVRLANLVPDGVTSNLNDDFKNALWCDDIDYVALGAKLSIGSGTTQQVYIVTNPSNASTVTTSAVVRRCNAVWKRLDYYGNTLSEPFVWDKGAALSTADWASEYMINAQSYNHSVMQINPETSDLNNNTRLILGNSAYFVRGLVNFLLDFTGAQQSYIQYFDLERTEPNEYDDLTNGIANGLAFSWTIQISGADKMTVGGSQTLSAASTKNGQAVSSTAANPISYLWSVDDETVATITTAGVITAVGAGTAVITAKLAENTSIMATLSVEVSAQVSGDYVQFTSATPAIIGQYSTAILTAAHFRDGAQAPDTIVWTVSGTAGTFGYEVSGNSISLTSYAPTTEGITLTAAWGDYTATVNIAQGGY